LIQAISEIRKKDCNLCGLKPAGCICTRIPQIEITSKLSVIIHITELGRRTNSGQLAALSVKDGNVVPYGMPVNNFDYRSLLSSKQKPLLLFPGSPRELTEDYVQSLEERPHLVVVDGNWRQAKRMFQKLMRTREFDWISLPYSTTGGFPLRNSSMKTGTVSTMEATALALKALEGEEPFRQMLGVFDDFVTAHLEARTCKISGIISRKIDGVSSDCSW
jgi:DTW domain-containing protein